MTILVTGAAGFIGHALSARLLARGENVIGVDNLNDYYSVQLKRDRIADLAQRHRKDFWFANVDFSDAAALGASLKPHRFDRIAHMGAQPGVRYSLTHPDAYARANLVG